MGHIETTSEMLRKVFAENQRVYVGFSGGKDSMALAELCDPWRDQVTLISVDTGHLFKHMVDHINGYGDRFELKWIQGPDQAENWTNNGLPGRIVPVENVDLYGRGIYRGPKMQAWQLCCRVLIVAPMIRFLQARSGSVFLHGQRKSEIAPGYAPSPSIFEAQNEGCAFYAPLAEWSEVEVLDYLDDVGATLPMQYSYRTADFSLDCANCPAMLQREKIEFMRGHYPQHLAEAVGHLRKTNEAVKVALDEAANMLELAEV